MRTETRTFEVYAINELSKQAQSKAYYKWLELSDYDWVDENRATLKAFTDIFNVKCTNFSYDANRYNYHFMTTLTDAEEELCGQRLAAYIYNNYSSKLFSPKIYWNKNSSKKRKSQIFTDNSSVLTGYYMDDTILHPIYEFLKHPNSHTTFLALLDTCLDEFFKGCRDDIADNESQEHFVEISISNKYEYLRNGTRFN